jgi:CDP-L-myo-inositol myo-inositolphosphotransferase
MDEQSSWTAVVIAAGHDRLVSGRPVPLHRVAGVSVLGRHILAARHSGASRCCLAVRPGSNELLQEARRYWPDADSLAVVEMQEGDSETDALRAAVREDDQQVVPLFADLSFSRNLLQALLQEGLGDLDALVAVGEPDRFIDGERFHRPIGSDYGLFSGLVLLSGKAAANLSAGSTLAEALEEASADLRMRFRPMENSFALKIEESEDLKRAEDRQVQALRRNYDGLVSRWLNRPVSLFLSRYLFLRLPLTPNHITLFSGVVGWVGIGLVLLWPGYWWVLLGSALFHLSSILDGCDGEIARLRYQFSRVGEWFDNLLDEFNNTAFIAAIGLGSYRAGGSEALALTAIFYCLTIAICDSAVFYQLVRWRGGTGNFEKFKWFFEPEASGPPPNPTAYPPRRTLGGWLKELPRRDFYIFLFLLLAAVDQLVVGFWIASATALVLFPLGVIQWIYQIRGKPGSASSQ